jgi:hypothetical protein
MKLLLIIICFLNLNDGFFAQNLERFEYLQKDISEVTIDLSKEFNKLLSLKKAIVYCDIYDRSLNPPEAHKKEVESWLSPYNTSKFYTCFSVFNIESNDGYNVNFTLSDQTEKFNKLVRSTVFVLTKDSLFIEALNIIGKDLSLFEVFSFKNKNSETIKLFQLVGIRDFSDFQWKTNQILYNLDNIQISPKKEIQPKPKKLYFQVGYQSSLSKSNNTQFDGFTINQVDLLIKKSNLKNTVIGGGISFSQTNFSSSTNDKYAENGTFPLDSIYASLIAIDEKYTNQSINLVGYFALKGKKVEISLSPFYSIYNVLNSTTISGSITTFGYNAQINEYLYDLPELGLKTQTSEIVGIENSFKSSSFGLNIGVSYNFDLGKNLSVSPSFNLKMTSIRNRSSITDCYSISNGFYNGWFSTLQNTSLIVPTVGLSISF